MRFFPIPLMLLLLGAQLSLHAASILSEIMPANTQTLTDEDGDFSDWIEINNPSPNAESLSGWFLTDSAAVPKKWRIESLTLAPGEYRVVFASGKDRTNSAVQLHTNFKLNADGGYVALVRPDGSVASAFAPYPKIKNDVAYGIAQTLVPISLLATTVPQYLVPQNAQELSSSWNAKGFIPSANWTSGFAPPALGFDIGQAEPIPSNLAPGGAALQSTTLSANGANLAIDGNPANFSSTLNTDNAPFWQVRLAGDSVLRRVVLRNRTSCCGSRLRDLTVEILGTNAGQLSTNFSSALLNPENEGFTYPNGPAFLELDLIALTGSPVNGQIVRVRRTPDPDLSGSNGQGTSDEAAILALGEVEVWGTPGVSPQVNLARTGTPAPTATESSVLNGFPANQAINGSKSDFSHTVGTDTNATWTLNLGRRAIINSIQLHNRESCCGSRLRDITVQILAPDSNTVVYVSPLLNPENAGYSYPNGPADLVVNLSDNPVAGQFVRIKRAPDLDLSGTGGQGNTDESAVLALAEVTVLGRDLNGYRQFIRTDLQDRMLGLNASAFVRMPFIVPNPSALTALRMDIRYDDGFVAYLNGVEVARRNAPDSLAWNSAATIDRDVAAAVTPETLDLASQIGLLTAGPNVLAIQGLNVSASDDNFLLEPELNSASLTTVSNVFLVNATPGSRNDSDYYSGEVGDTKFSVDRGFFETNLSLTLTSATPSAVIYYSVNGDEPGPGKSPIYTGPITITNTTILRARAFRDGWKPTQVDTHTYLFLADVIHQAPDWPQTRVPPPNFPATWGVNSVDYGMDPNVVSRYTAADWKEALTQIPSISIVTEMKNLFDPNTGIYANALQHGVDWERPGSIEFLEPTNDISGVFQENCGVRIRGGYSRNTQYVKHSLRVFFRADYGASKLNYPLYGTNGASSFDTFDLRTSQNYSWSLGDPHETLVREEFCEETLGALGQPYRRNRYAHLYLNGQYWGIYEFDERPEASYGETYLGGSKTNYDVVKCGNHVLNFVTEATDGNLFAWSNLWVMTQTMRTNAANSNYFRILGQNPDGTRQPAWPVMLDVDNLIDYLLEIFYSGDGDATLSSFLGNNQPNNWFGMRDRTNPDQGFRFFNSDCEHTLGAPSSQVDRTGPFGGSNEGNFAFSNPQWMHEALLHNAEYRLRFADHVQRHFFNGGPLTFSAATNRFLAKAAQITKAIRAYSARWGDAATEPPLGEAQWQTEINWIMANWFPARANLVLQQLRGDNLVTAAAAPSFSQLGGAVPAGYSLILDSTNAQGSIFFTLDGSDPRAVGGTVSPGAQAYSTPLILNGPTLVRARVFNGTNWSAIIEAVFHPPQDFSKLMVSEIMYHPPDFGTNRSDELEFLELKNIGTQPLNLTGLRFTAGITYAFPFNTVVPPGGFYVLGRNPNAFALRYPGVHLNGIYTGKLDNGGELLALSHPLGSVLFSFAFADSAPWPITPDGYGFSLVPVDPNANANPESPTSWRASSVPGGTPGADDPGLRISRVVINEVLSHSETNLDFIELFNPETAAADIGGWFLTDDPNTPKKFRVPDHTQIPAGGYWVFDESNFNSPPGLTNGFALSAHGDDVYLFSGDDATNLTGYSHGFAFDGAADGVTFGRYVISTGEEQFPAQIISTRGGPNAGPRVGPVVLTEIQYHPPAGDDEFVEIKNITPNTVPLYDPAHPTNTWRLNGLAYQFPTNIALAPQQLLLLVPTAPAAFRARHSVATNVQILGPYGGQLQDSGERLALQGPDVPDTNGVAYITIDEVRYNDHAPWPPAADGAGPSLQRKDPAVYGNDPANWEAAFSTPGADFHAGQAPAITAQPQSQVRLVGESATLGVWATGPEPLGFQWQFNGRPLNGATRSNLFLNPLRLTDAGDYSVVIFNGSGSAASAVAHLTVLQPAFIFTHPSNQFVRLGSNALFSVSATGNGILRYQWRFNAVSIPGATNATFALTNAQLTDVGDYSVIVTDAVGPTLSANAALRVLILPVIAQQPLGVDVPAGGTATLSVTVSNTATWPLGFRWRRNGSTFGFFSLSQNTSFLTVTNVQTSAIFTVVVTNAANTVGILSSNAPVNVVADADHDGIPDDWEIAHGMNPADPNDALGDRDGDGMSNWAEYIAGTDPNDSSSYLRIDRLSYPSPVVEFLAVSNRSYTVQYREGSIVGPWLRLGDIPVGPTTRVERVPDPTAGTNRFYRLLTPRTPP